MDWKVCFLPLASLSLTSLTTTACVSWLSVGFSCSSAAGFAFLVIQFRVPGTKDRCEGPHYVPIYVCYVLKAPAKCSTSLDVLFDIWQHISQQRFFNEDENQRFMCCWRHAASKDIHSILNLKLIFDVQLMKVPFATLFAFSIDQQKRDIKVVSSNIVSCTLLDANNVTVRTINTTARLWFGMKEVRLNKELVRISSTAVTPTGVTVKNNFQSNEQIGGLGFSRGAVNASVGSFYQLSIDT